MDTKQLLDAAETIRIIRGLFDTPQNEWLPVVAAIGGAFVGGISSIIPNYLIELKKRRDENLNVRSALVAEVESLLTILEHRKYIENLRLAEQNLKKSGGTLRFYVKIPDHYSRVYQSHIARIGVIDPRLASKIIRFHQLLDAIVQDIAPGGLIAEEGGSVEAFEQLVQMAEAAVTLGREITL